MVKFRDVAGFVSQDLRGYWRRKNKKPIHIQAQEAMLLCVHYKYAPYHYFKSHLCSRYCTEEITDYIPPQIIMKYTHNQNSLGMRLLKKVVVDKAAFHDFMNESGLPSVETLSVVEEDGRLARDGIALDLAALKAAAGSGSAIFLKPRRGAQGEGARIIDIDSVGLAELKAMPSYVIQPLISQHPAMEALSLRSINTVRIDTFLDADVLTHNAAVLRTGFGNSPIDNWRSGGIAVGIDLQSGRLMRTGWRKNNFGDGSGYEAHPDTRVEFLNYQIPYWEDCKALVRSAAIRMQPLVSLGWDVVITPKGPILLEVNDTWDVHLMQTAWGGLRKTLLGRRALEARGTIQKVAPGRKETDLLSP